MIFAALMIIITSFYFGYWLGRRTIVHRLAKLGAVEVRLFHFGPCINKDYYVKGELIYTEMIK